MDLLPNEILEDILSFLPYSDLENARLVSRRFYFISVMPSFLKLEKLKYDAKSDSRDISMVNEIWKKVFSGKRILYHFEFLNTKVSDILNDICADQGNSVQSIYLSDCEISRKAFENIVRKCPNLRMLYFEEVNNTYMTDMLIEDSFEELPKLMKVDSLIIVSKNLSDKAFNNYMYLAPYNEYLTIRRCNATFHSGIFHRFYPEVKDYKEADLNSKLIFTFNNVVNYLNNHKNSIAFLNISSSNLTDKDLMKVAHIPFKNFTKLYMNACNELTRQGVIAFVRKQGDAVQLDIFNEHAI